MAARSILLTLCVLGFGLLLWGPDLYDWWYGWWIRVLLIGGP